MALRKVMHLRAAANASLVDDEHIGKCGESLLVKNRNDRLHHLTSRLRGPLVVCATRHCRFGNAGRNISGRACHSKDQLAPVMNAGASNAGTMFSGNGFQAPSPCGQSDTKLVVVSVHVMLTHNPHDAQLKQTGHSVSDCRRKDRRRTSGASPRGGKFT